MRGRRLLRGQRKRNEANITVNLVPLMDRVMALNGPLHLTLDRTKGIVVRVEEEELRLEPLPKPEDP